MSDQPDKKALLHKVLKFEGIAFVLIGFLFSTKSYFSDFILIDADTDLYLGYGLVLVGFVNFFIANKFFGQDSV